MQPSTFDDDPDSELTARFLLGELDDRERDAFETRLIADESLHALARAIEEELIEAYLDGELPEGRRASLERSLHDPVRAERVVLLRALAAAIAARPAHRTEPRRLGMRRLVPALAFAAAAAALLLIWLLGGRDQPTGGTIATLALPAPTRAAAAIVIRRATLPERVRLEPELGPLPAGARLQMVLRRRGATVAGSVVEALQPAFEVVSRDLVPGAYVLEVSADGAPIGRFELRIVE
jgi:anti-sigma factor RsiW